MYFLELIYLFCSYIDACFQLVAFVREHIWQKALLMGYSMKLELTCVCSLNDFQLVAAGLDEIPPEVWKTRQFDDILLRHCNAVYNQNPIDRWTKGCILPFPKKGDLGLAKNYRGITLTSIAAKIYNALLRNRIEPKIDNILRKKPKWLPKK